MEHLKQRTGRFIQNSPRSSEDKTVVRLRQENKPWSLLLDNTDSAIRKQPVMLRHCRTATVPEYSMLSWRQDAAMALEHIKEINNQSCNCMNFIFFSSRKNSTAVFTLRLGNSSSINCHSKATRAPIICIWTPCGWQPFSSAISLAALVMWDIILCHQE